MAADDDVVWVADAQGRVVRLSATDTSQPTTTISTTSSPQALAVNGRDVWVATRASPLSHRGGTLYVTDTFPLELDPLGFPDYNASIWEADGLVGYRHVGGVSGSALLPNLAVALPTPTDGGRKYTFHLRSGLLYSTGADVMPGDFRRAVERAISVEDQVGGLDVLTSIVGVQDCIDDPDACDLSAGIVTSDVTNTVVFNLVEPDPDFLHKMATSAAFPVPDGVSMDGFVEGAFPGTGPYVVSDVSENEVRMTRNPHFQVWDAEVRPDGLVDEIVWTAGIDPTEQLAMVERGETDWMPLRNDNQITADQFEDVRARYTGQVQFGSKSVVAAFLNIAMPPFDNLEARQALNMAIDRQATADLFGGPVAVSITCQVLPPGWFGYEPYCPYTTHPDPGGRWQAPDLSAARQLVAASGTAGASVHVGPFRARHAPLGDYLVSALNELGYEVSVDLDTDEGRVSELFSHGAIQVGAFQYSTGTLAPSEL